MYNSAVESNDDWIKETSSYHTTDKQTFGQVQLQTLASWSVATCYHQGTRPCHYSQSLHVTTDIKSHDHRLTVRLAKWKTRQLWLLAKDRDCPQTWHTDNVRHAFLLTWSWYMKVTRRSEMYLHTKSKVSGSRLSKVRAWTRQTDRQTWLKVIQRRIRRW